MAANLLRRIGVELGHALGGRDGVQESPVSSPAGTRSHHHGGKLDDLIVLVGFVLSTTTRG